MERWWPLIYAASRATQLSPAILEAVIHAGSEGDPNAFTEPLAGGGARFGLMQLRLQDARALGYAGPARELFDPARNLQLGAARLAALVVEWADYEAAVVAYHFGPIAARLTAFHLPAGPPGAYGRAVMKLFTRYHARNKARGPA